MNRRRRLIIKKDLIETLNTNLEINLFQQFYISDNEERYEEIKYCLKKNVENLWLDNIYLLNERYYTDEELGVKSSKIKQIIIGKRLTYKLAFEDMLNKKESYCILSNSDIFFDESIKILNYTNMSEEKILLALSRYEYSKNKKLSDCKLFHLAKYSQDTWILNNKYLKGLNLENLNFSLGIHSCDNHLAYLMTEKKFKLLNDNKDFRTYHYHTSNVRPYLEKELKILYPYLYIDLQNRRKYDIFQLDTTMEFLDLQWQKPVITELEFYRQNYKNSKFFGFPWAEVLDKNINLNSIENIIKDKAQNCYTCCQHIHFRKLIPLFKKLNITTIYASHKTIQENNIDGIIIKPCPLYAVNIEDEERNHDFQNIDFINKERQFLYSFQGAYNKKIYMSDIREKIFNLPEKENNKIIKTKEWHFEKAVYHNDQSVISDKLKSYNNLLLNSRFSLCPSGSGSNSIRLWESLATGAIPILLSDQLDLPSHSLWEDAIIKLDEKNIHNVEDILSKITKKQEENMRINCIKIYNYFKNNYINNYTDIIHYCCDTYFNGSVGGVARYDYQIWKIFPKRKFFQGPREKNKMLDFLKKCINPLIITDNHLSCDIPNDYKILLVHHGCAKTTADRNPDWGEPWRSLCLNGQNKMLDFRDPDKTTIISISKSCNDDFTNYYGEKYKKFKRYDILHPSELDEKRFKKSFNDKPIVLGNWLGVKKGEKIIPRIKTLLKEFNFQQLNVKIVGNNIEDFNKRKQDIYLKADIFLQISNSEGNSYATLDALICGLPVVSSNVGLFYKDLPEDCFIKIDWKRNNDIDYIKSKLLEAWNKRKELSINARNWYMKNCRFIDWEKKMKSIIENID